MAMLSSLPDTTPIADLKQRLTPRTYDLVRGQVTTLGELRLKRPTDIVDWVGCRKENLREVLLLLEGVIAQPVAKVPATLQPSDRAYLYLLLTIKEAGLVGKPLAWARRHGISLFGDTVVALQDGCRGAGRKTVEQVKDRCYAYGIPWPVQVADWGPAQVDKLRVEQRVGLEALALELHYQRFAPTRTLEQDYDHMLTYADLSPAHKHIVWKYFGLGANPPTTLEAAAAPLTRERARQVTDKTIQVLRTLNADFFPVLKAAHQRLITEGPALVKEVGPWLLREKFTQTGVHGEGCLKLLTALGYPMIPASLRLLQTGGGVRDKQLDQQIACFIRRLSARFGAVEKAAIPRMMKGQRFMLTAHELDAVLNEMPAVYYLYAGSWVRLDGSKRDMLLRVLARLGSLQRKYTTMELYQAWTKALPRLWKSGGIKYLIPEPVFVDLLRHLPEWELVGTLWRYKLTEPVAIHPVEASIAQVLAQAGRAMARAEILQGLLALGCKYTEDHVSIYLSLSPFWQHTSQGYLLLGVA